MKRALLRFLLLGMAGTAIRVLSTELRVQVMKLPLRTLVCCILVAASAPAADDAIAVSTERPSGFADPGMNFGSAVDGNRVGMWNERASYGLRHLPNVWVALEEKGQPLASPIADYIPGVTVPTESVVILVHPDGSVSWQKVGWPADGPVGARGWILPIGNVFYPAIQAPGIYTVRFKLAGMEAGPVTFEVVPEAEDFIADSRLGFYEALRTARGAAAQIIRADASKRGYEPLFAGGRDDEEETWVTFLKRFNDGHRENPDHAIVAYDKKTGALRWVPIE